MSQDYPANTVRGRICLALRLDWDRDGSKETSDIYIKPRWVFGAFLNTRIRVSRAFFLQVDRGGAVFINIQLWRSLFLQVRTSVTLFMLGFNIYGWKFSVREICTFRVTFRQFSSWPGVKMSHQRAREKLPSCQVHQGQ